MRKKIVLSDGLQSYYERIEARALSWTKAVIIEQRGRYENEKVVITVGDDGTVIIPQEHLSNEWLKPTPREQEAIKAEWPEHLAKRPKQILAPWGVVAELTQSGDQSRGPFYVMWQRKPGDFSESRYAIMVQERIEADRRRYIPWTWWDDNEWRQFEPEGGLPFWKPRKATMRSGGIMIHEGAKAAEAAERIVSNMPSPGRPWEVNHPWREELAKWEHWGMLGGAIMGAHKTDWAELRAIGPEHVAYACDNDILGIDMLPNVSKVWGKPLTGLQYPGDWPKGWDIADPIPPLQITEKLERSAGMLDGRYVGLPLKRFYTHGTCATILYQPPPTGNAGRPPKPIAQLNPDFANEWIHCIEPKIICHRDKPHEMITYDNFDATIRPFAHKRASPISTMLLESESGRADIAVYSPNRQPGLGSTGDKKTLNTYVPSFIEPMEGDASKWEELLEYLFPNPKDRHEIIRWVVTLVSRPDVKLFYGLLLVTEQTGIGKSFFGTVILGKLVGDHNYGEFGENQVLDSNFTDWYKNKKLALCHEIYQSESKRAYNKLKTIVTDPYLTIHEKYLARYRIDNWLSVIICSNDKNALKMDKSDDDRRWFIPELTTIKRPDTYWTDLKNWLRREDGYSFVRHWCDEKAKERDEHGNLVYVVPEGRTSPSSVAKDEITHDNLNREHKFVDEVFSTWRAALGDQVIVTTDKECLAAIQSAIESNPAWRPPNGVLTEKVIRTLARANGFTIVKTRIIAQRWGETKILVKNRYIITTDPSLVDVPPAEIMAKYPELSTPINIVREVQNNHAM